MRIAPWSKWSLLGRTQVSPAWSTASFWPYWRITRDAWWRELWKLPHSAWNYKSTICYSFYSSVIY